MSISGDDDVTVVAILCWCGTLLPWDRRGKDKTSLARWTFSSIDRNYLNTLGKSGDLFKSGWACLALKFCQLITMNKKLWQFSGTATVACEDSALCRLTTRVTYSLCNFCTDGTRVANPISLLRRTIYFFSLSIRLMPIGRWCNYFENRASSNSFLLPHPLPLVRFLGLTHLSLAAIATSPTPRALKFEGWFFFFSFFLSSKGGSVSWREWNFQRGGEPPMW